MESPSSRTFIFPVRLLRYKMQAASIANNVIIEMTTTGTINVSRYSSELDVEVVWEDSSIFILSSGIFGTWYFGLWTLQFDIGKTLIVDTWNSGSIIAWTLLEMPLSSFFIIDSSLEIWSWGHLSVDSVLLYQVTITECCFCLKGKNWMWLALPSSNISCNMKIRSIRTKIVAKKNYIWINKN